MKYIVTIQIKVNNSIQQHEFDAKNSEEALRKFNTAWLGPEFKVIDISPIKDEDR